MRLPGIIAARFGPYDTDADAHDLAASYGVARLDPPGCRCKDCRENLASPVDTATPDELLAALCGLIPNRSGHEITVTVPTLPDTSGGLPLDT